MQFNTLLHRVKIKESSVCSNQFNRLFKHPRIIHLVEDLSKLTMVKINKILEACKCHHKQDAMEQANIFTAYKQVPLPLTLKMVKL